jgi:PTS system nitrogen regulatory IIA component
MGLSNILDKRSIALRDPATNAEEVLERVAALAMANPAADRLKQKEVLRLLKDREQIGSTGLGHGIGIPHCAMKGLDQFIVGVLTLAQPVDFRSLDGGPTDLFFFIIGPRDERNRHIKLLSAIAKATSQAEFAAKLRSARKPQEVLDLLSRTVVFEDERSDAEKVLFQIFIQNMDHFEEILNLLSSAVPGSISVLETRNAGAYLFSMPLFAAFWSESRTHEGRVILAIAERQAANSLIRQIEELTGDPESQTGVLVTVQNLSYAAGSLDF